ncbi:MAG: glycosyltransferase family 39 protein [Acidimicrobiales bacterium]
MASMVVGTGIRLDVPRGLWLDEAISVSEARMPYLAMIHRLATSDVHPPLYFSILWLSGRLIGFGDFAVRVPSIIFGVLLIPLVYLLGKEAYDRKTGAVAAVIVSVAPYVLWYSQEARMYELLMVFGVICLWAQLRILHHGGWYPWVLYTLASIAMVCTQYFGIWQLLTQQLIFIGVIVFRWRRDQKPGALLRPWLCSAAVVLTALIPLGLMMKGQFANAQNTGQAFRGAAGASLSVYSVITNFGYAVVGFHSTPVMSDLVSLWPFGMLAALVLLGRRCKPVSYLLVVMVVVPVAAMFVLGDLKESLADVRYQSTIVPVLLLLIARAVTSLATSKRALGVVMVLIVAVMSVALFNQQFSSSNPRRYNFREALHRVDSQARPGDVILYDPVADELNTVVSYYSPRVKSRPLSSAPTVAAGHTTFIVASAILMDASDRRIFYSALGHLNFHRKHPPEHWVFPNVQVWVYR